MINNVHEAKDPKKEIRERLNRIMETAEKNSKKSNMSDKEFIRIATEAGKTFNTDERSNNAEGYIL